MEVCGDDVVLDRTHRPQTDGRTEGCGCCSRADRRTDEKLSWCSTWHRLDLSFRDTAHQRSHHSTNKDNKDDHHDDNDGDGDVSNRAAVVGGSIDDGYFRSGQLVP